MNWINGTLVENPNDNLKPRCEMTERVKTMRDALELRNKGKDLEIAKQFIASSNALFDESYMKI